MSTALSDMANIFATALSGLALGYPIAWENQVYNPTAPNIYLRPHMLPSSVQALGPGQGAMNRHDGIYQISVFCPSEGGWGPLLGIADTLATAFKRGTTLSLGTTTVIVKSAQRGPYMEEPDWFHIPLSINFYATALP